MVGEMITTRVAPSECFRVTIRIDIVGGILVPIVSNPALIPESARAPLYQRRLPHPGIIVILTDVAVLSVLGGIQGL